MNPDICDTVERFISEWPEGHGPCSFFVTGGGFSVLNIGKWPGASKVLADAVIAYHMLEEIAFLKTGCASGEIELLTSGREGFGFVSAYATSLYTRVMTQRHKETMPDNSICVVNAALTSNRFRKGSNRAFYSFVNRPCDNKDGQRRYFRYEINKLSEADYYDKTGRAIAHQRILEDEKVAQVAMALMMDDPSLITLMEPGEKIVAMELNHHAANPLLWGGIDKDVWISIPLKDFE